MRWFIGDIHGCRTELHKILKRIHQKDDSPEIYTVGDVINKGPDTLGVLNLLDEYQVRSVRGNHEWWLLKLMDEKSHPHRNKDHAFLKQFGSEREKWFQKISEWPLYYVWDDIILVHAGLEPGHENPTTMSERILLTIRTWDGIGENLNNPLDPAWYECGEWQHTIVFGHWAAHGYLRQKGIVSLDSGCVYGGELRAWCAETDEFLVEKAEQVYCPIR